MKKILNRIEQSELELKRNTFIITINDEFCKYEYPLYIGNENSIEDVITKIYKAFKLPKEKGKLVK